MMPQAVSAPQTPVTPYAVSNTNYHAFSLDPDVLTPSPLWSPNFATPYMLLQSFSTHHTSSSLSWPTSSCPPKRKHVHDENLPSIQLLNLSLPKKWKSLSSPQQKIVIVLSAIKNDASWSLSEFLFHIFQDQDQDGKTIECKQSHGNTVQTFLSGWSKHSPSEILEIWWHHRDSHLDRDSELMYSMSTPFTEIKPVRPAQDTLLAVQQACTASQGIFQSIGWTEMWIFQDFQQN
jgi:hypothetical protein